MAASRLLIVKIGGNVIDDPACLESFLEKFAALPGKKILVHGGGKIASQLAVELGIPVQMVEGRRITDEPMLRIATMVYAGWTNKQIVARLQTFGCDAVGLSGADGNTIQAIKRPVKEIDFGYVGDLMHDSVQVAAVKKFLDSGFTPVFSAITHNGQGQLLNTNADTIAASLAISMTAIYETSLVYCFDKKGVLRDVSNDQSVIPEITMMDFERLKKTKTIVDGMIPKLQNAFDAISKGVSDVSIGHADYLHLIQQKQFGTRMVLGR
jgi:acetylglutamate kinase